MANEIETYARVTVSKGDLSFTRETLDTVTMSGTTYASGAVSIPTTEGGTALALGGVTTAGVAYFKNLDATNYAQLGVQVGGTFYPFAKLKPGEAGVIRLGTNAPYALANTAAVVLDYTIVQD